MAISNFLSTKWSAFVELAAQETSIASRITGGQYQADATGTTAVKAATVGDINIIDYTNDTDLSALQSLTDSAITINLNQKKAFNYSIDDVDNAQSTADFSPAALTQGAKGLALSADAYVMGLYSDAGIPAANKIGAVGTSIALTAANVDEYIYQMKEKLDEQNAGPNRWLVVPSWVMSLLALNGLGIQLADTDKADVWRTGEVMVYAGFNIIQSNQIKAVGTGSDEYQIMAFTDRAIPMCANVQKVEALRNPSKFGDIVRGLYVFGASVAFPKEVVVLSAEKA